MTTSQMVASRRGRTAKYANGRARREEIIDVATGHFASNGYDAATILDIAAKAQISRAGLLHHFPDKETLLAAVLEARDADDQERFRPYVEVGGALGVLVGMVDLTAHNRLVPGLIQLFVRMSTEATAADHPAHEYFVARYERICGGTEKALRAAQRSGYVQPEIDSTTAAERLTALMDGLQCDWLLMPTLKLEAHIESSIKSILTESGAAEFDATRRRIEKRVARE